MHNGNLTIVRDSLQSLKEDSLLLRSGAAIQLDALVLATGWGDHFAMFDAETKQELGLPSYGKPSCPEDRTPDKAWDAHDQAADRSVNEKLPLLAEAPRLRNPHTSSDKAHRRWRLYRRSIPLQLALKGDRSLAIMGQIHTVQTPLVSEVQSLWSILYLLGELELPDHEVMAREIAEWNAWTRKRYLSQGEKFPYSLYDFLPVGRSPDDLPLPGLQTDVWFNFAVYRFALRRSWHQHAEEAESGGRVSVTVQTGRFQGVHRRVSCE